jgi:hypothetical protein
MQNLPTIQGNEEPFFINSMFEHDSEGHYTKKALLYQDFMEFAFVEKHEPIRVRDFAKWIVEKNVEIANHYKGFSAHMSTSNKIANHDRTIKKCICNLEASLLICKIGTTKAKKNDEIIPLYAYTIHGQIIALILLYNRKPDKRASAGNKILDLIQGHFGAYGSHIVDFVVKLITKARERGFSDSIVKTLSEVLHNSSIKSTSVINAINWCLYFHLEKEPHKNVFFDLWKETLDELDPTIRNIILYHDKSEIENRIGLYQPPKEWEEMWIKNIHEFSKLVLYGVCKQCLQSYPLLVDYYTYRKEILIENYLKFDCEGCKAKESFYVSSRLPKSEYIKKEPSI